MVSTFWLINIGMTREGYAAQGLRHAFRPAIVSTSGRIHGQLLRLLFNLADKKTSNSISGACEPPLAWRARKPLPWALRSSAALALGLAMPRAPATELVFWHRVSDCAPKGCGLLFSFLFLFYLFALSALACCSEVTVTSVSLPPFVSRRGLSNTNQRLSPDLFNSPASRSANLLARPPVLTALSPFRPGSSPGHVTQLSR